MFVAGLVLALVAGCSVAGPASPSLGEPVQLITGFPASGEGGCFLLGASGLLVVDPKYGTALIDENPSQNPSGGPITVAWRRGFTGRRVGSEVAVLDPSGKVVAMTGKRYRLDGGFVGGETWPQLPVIGAFWACDHVVGL